MKDIRIAAVISHSPVGKTSKNLDRMVEWIKAASKKDVDIICFPEMNITGYSTHREVITDLAESLNGPIVPELLNLAESENIVILGGIAEREEGGRIFASHVVAYPNGKMDVYRKLHIAQPERAVFTPGDKIPLFESHGVKFGIQLCYDAHFPELSTHMALKGADLIFMPHASPRGDVHEKYKSWKRHLPARAYDNSLFIIACNQIGENEKGLKFPGIALVIGPSGEIIEKDLSGKEGMVVGDIKADDLAGVRSHKMKYFLPNRRPELYDSL